MIPVTEVFSETVFKLKHFEEPVKAYISSVESNPTSRRRLLSS